MASDDMNIYEDDSDDEPPDLILDTPDATENLGTTDASSAPAINNHNSENNNNSNSNNAIINSNSDAPACPVTILSGFLGSGKTTLIQHILRSPDHGKRIAVIENEFGEGLAIESLIARDGIDPGSGSLQDLIELPNGCVCCTVKDTLVATLENLVEKRSDLDYILIEASGMADPGPIASVFWLDDALESRLRLDGIVTLVDGRHILEQLEATEEAARQIAYADRIVLNKVDLLTGDKSVRDVEQAVRSIHPTAPILRTSFSKIPDLSWILDADCFGGFSHLEEVETGLRNAGVVEDSSDDSDSHETCDHHDDHEHHDHHHDHEHAHHHDNDDQSCSDCSHGDDDGEAAGKKHLHQHDDHHHDDHHHDNHHEHKHKHTASITTVAFDRPGSVDVNKLNAWLADILWPNQDETDKVLTAMLYNNNQEHEGTTEFEKNDTEDVPTPPRAIHKGDGSSSSSTEQKIFRIKGIVSVRASNDFDDDPLLVGGDPNPKSDSSSGGSGAELLLDRRRFIVQAVHDLWDIQPVTSSDLNWSPGEERTGKIVVIGKHLREESLRAGFRACFLP